MKAYLTEAQVAKIVENRIEKYLTENEVLDEDWWSGLKSGLGQIGGDIKKGAQNATQNVQNYGKKIAQASRDGSKQADAEKANQAKAKYNAFVKQGYVSKQDQKNQQGGQGQQAPMQQAV